MSLYEGFGFPVLEAMACGVPVVASSAAAMPEVLGDAALLVPPEDPVGLAEAMTRILEDGACADRLRTRGLERAATYSWQTSAQRLLAAYRRTAAW